MRVREDRPRSAGGARARALRPGVQGLEDRVVLSTNINLGLIATNNFGVLNAGTLFGNGAGFSVAEVGDVNGDGFDDYLIGAPSITVTGSTFNLGNGASSRAFLVFGSRQVGTPPNIDFTTLNTQQRIGDLAMLGNTSQSNPTNGSPGFAFDGLTFMAGQNASAALGASVASVGDVNGDGLPDFMIGAPGANDINGVNPGTGRAYLVYGSPNLVRSNKMVDFDNLGAATDLTIVSFESSAPAIQLGRSVAGVGAVITGGPANVAIGAPGASVGGLVGNGAVYLLASQGANNALRPAITHTVNVTAVGQPGGVPGVLFGGGSSGDGAGTSISTAGNFDGTRLGGTIPVIDMVIGAPHGTTGPGSASLIYGSPNLPANEQNLGNGVFGYLLSSVGTTLLPGATFTGTNNGDETGFAVAFAGDFNGDGLGDIMIGSPGFNTTAGRVNLIFGRAAGTNNANRINGTFALDNLTTAGITSVQFNGQASGSLAGYSLAAVGKLNSDPLPVNEIAIGAPGDNSGAGTVYLIPGNPNLVGTFTLNAAINNATVQGLLISSSTPTTPNFVGTSVSSTLLANGSGRTVDGDSVPDLIIGSAGFSLTTAAANAGAGFVVEGRFVGLSVPANTAISSQLGVSNDPTQTSPNTTPVTATTPTNLKVFILPTGSTDPTFTDPFTQIVQSSIVVTGPNGTATPISGSFLNEPPGTTGLSFLINRNQLNLTGTSATLTVTATTTTGRRYRSTITIQVVGAGPSGGGGGLPTTAPSATFGAFVGIAPPFGERLIPTPQVLSQLTYKPIPITRAYVQFFPTLGFRQRLNQFLHPQSQEWPRGSGHKDRFEGHGINTLGKKVFTSFHFQPGKRVPPIHHGKRGGLNSIPPSLP